MDEPTRISAQLTGSSVDDPFRFDAGDGWMEHVRSAETAAGLGRIGPYEIIEEVGRGGQGIVYRARQPNTRRQIALKRLVAGAFASATARRRFEREVEAVTVLNHPNIVTVYGMEIVDGQPLLAMEWIDGRPINKWAIAENGKSRPTRELLQMFLSICDAMRHAHARGVIHRDLKPGNILVTTGIEGSRDQGTKEEARTAHPSIPRSLDPSVPSPKILDFGLAKLIDPEHAAAPEVTLSDEFVGTPAYAAPEQVRLDNQAIDARTDVYSLGMILFQMLTGGMPYEISRNLAVLIDTIQTVEPKRPSSINPKLDRDIDTIVLKALAKEQRRRYQTVDALAEDVRRCLAGDPILAHPPQATYYLKKMLWRYRLPAAIAGIAFAAIVAVGCVAIVQAVRANRLLDRTYVDYRALAASEKTMVLAIANIHKAAVESEPVNVVGSLEEARRRVSEGFLVDADALPSIDGGLAAVFAEIGQLDRAEDGYRAALRQLREQNRAESAEYAQNENALARVLDSRGEWREAESLLRDAWRIRKNLKGSDHPDVAMTMNDLAVVMLGMQRSQEARSLLNQALATVSRWPAPSERNRGILHLNLGRALLQEGEAGARREFDQALSSFRRLAFHRFEEYADALLHTASLDAAAGRFDAAESGLLEALTVWRECLGDWHPRLAFALIGLGEVLAKQARWDDALHRFREALAIRRLALGEDHPLTLQARAAMERCAAASPGTGESRNPATMPGS